VCVLLLDGYFIDTSYTYCQFTIDSIHLHVLVIPWKKLNRRG